MRLATKLVCVYVFALLGITIVFALLLADNERRLVIALHERDAAQLVASMKDELIAAARSGDDQSMRAVLAKAVRQHTQPVALDMVNLDEVKVKIHPDAVETISTRRQIFTIASPNSSGLEEHRTYVPLEPTDDVSTSASNAKPMKTPPVAPRSASRASRSSKPTGVEVVSLDEFSKDRVQRSIVRAGVALLVTVVVSAIAIWIGAVLLLGRPLNKLILKVRRVAEGNFDRPVQIRSRDELGKLGSAINQMCDDLTRQRTRIDEETAARVATESQLRHADRLTTVGRLAAGVAHEMGTPLGVVSGRAELIAAGSLDDDSIRKSAITIKSESDRISVIIRNLLDFARRGTANRVDTNAVEIIDHTVSLLRPLAQSQSVELVWTPPPHQVFAKLDSSQIQQVLTNLIGNAMAAAKPHGRVEVELVDRPVSANADERLIIQVRDDGPGIDEEHQQRIFEPFFTTKDVGEGTGLGLSISHGIIEDHGGTISVQSKVGEGTCFTIELPMREEEVLVSSESRSITNGASPLVDAEL